MFELFKDIKVDWMGKRKILIAISIVILLAGLASAIGRQVSGGKPFNLGVDFQGGTVVTGKFKQKPSVDDIRGALQAAGVGEAVIQESTDKPDEVLIKIPNLGRREDVCPGVDEAGRCFVKKALDTFSKE